MSKKKAESRKTIQNRCDRNWSKAVKIAAGYKCQMCGMDDPEKVLNSHHIVARKYKAVRWDLKNGVCLCYKCHRFKAHGDDYLDQKKWHNFLDKGFFGSFKYWQVEKYGNTFQDCLIDIVENDAIKPLPMAELRKIDEALKLAVKED